MIPHRMRVAVPVIEIPNHCNGLGVRGPYRKAGPLDAIGLKQVSSELFVVLVVVPLGQQAEIEWGQKCVRHLQLGLMCRRTSLQIRS